MLKTSIGEISIDFIARGNIDYSMPWLYSFIKDNNRDIICSLEHDNYVTPRGKKIYSEEGLSWWKDGFDFEIAITGKDNKILGVMRSDRYWENISLTKTDAASISVFKTLCEIAFRNIVLFHKGVVVHASAINFQDNGIVFSGSSGTGKSTHANLWQKYKGAEILNADRPLLRINNNKVRVYGTPWSGTSEQHLSKSTPLSAIFMLEQHHANEIHILRPQQIISLLSARCYLPYFDGELMNIALSNVGEIIGKVPVYLLKCKPDLESVEKVISWLKM